MDYRSAREKAFNAGGRRPPIRADRRGPQGKTWVWVLSKEIKALNHRVHREKLLSGNTSLPHQAYPVQDRDFVEILLRSLQTVIKVNFYTGQQGSKTACEGE